MTLASWLVAASSAIALFLGFAHLYLTYVGPSFEPRDREVGKRLREVSLVIAPKRSFWRANIGFHASHSFGLIMLGTIYGYLALANSAFLFASPFLMGVGAVAWLAYLAMAALYWFVVPLALVAIALGLYTAAVAAVYLG